MSEAGLFTSGRAVSTLEDHHIKHTRYDHQVLLVALYLLQQGAYSAYCTESHGNTDTFEEWFDKQSREGRMFKYCSLFIELEILICRLCTLLRYGEIVSLVFSVWPHQFFQMVIGPCKRFSIVTFCTFWYFRCATVGLCIIFLWWPRISLMNTAIDSYRLVVVAYQICMTILIISHFTYMLLAPDSMIFINELESVQNDFNSSDVYHK